jgi:tetrapyrrole methylase family protein/MazG family protein
MFFAAALLLFLLVLPQNLFMEKAFRELFEAMQQNRKKCPWAKSRRLREQAVELASEVEELKQAIEKNDSENLREELGDVLWDALFIGVLAEEKGLFTVKEALDQANAKFKRRKPWVFGNETVRDAEHAVRRWHEIKKLEKQGAFK